MTQIEKRHDAASSSCCCVSSAGGSVCVQPGVTKYMSFVNNLPTTRLSRLQSASHNTWASAYFSRFKLQPWPLDNYLYHRLPYRKLLDKDRRTETPKTIIPENNSIIIPLPHPHGQKLFGQNLKTETHPYRTAIQDNSGPITFITTVIPGKKIILNTITSNFAGHVNRLYSKYVKII